MADEEFNGMLDRMTKKMTGKDLQDWKKIHGKGKAPERDPHALPLFPELESAMPNHLARSSLFAPIRRGRRGMFDKVKLSSRNDVSIYFSGKQLDMADNDVYLEILRMAQGRMFGEAIPITRHGMLKSMGRSTGKSDHKWLQDSIHRLTTATIEIEAPKYKAGFHLVDGYDLDEVTGQYTISINPKVQQLFSRGEYGFIDLDRRRALSKRVDLAKWLQNYACSHKRGDEQKITFAKLHQWTSSNSHLRDFRKYATEAMKELERVGEVENVEVTDTLVTWRRPVDK